MSMLVTLQEMKQYLGIPGVDYPVVSVDLTIDTTLGRITRATGNWAEDGITEGVLVNLTGFSNAANNVQVAVKSAISATVIEYLGPVGMVDETGVGTAFERKDQASDPTYDTFLTEQITLISDSIEGYLGRILSTATYTQTFYREDYGETDELFLYHFPVQSITTIEADAVAVTDYRLQKPIGLLSCRYGFFKGANVLEVEYEAGFTSTPTAIKHVVYSLVEERYNKKKTGVSLNFGSDVQRISIPGTISIDFDYTLQSNERKNAYGTFLGSYLNVLDSFRSERPIIGSGKVTYVD